MLTIRTGKSHQAHVYAAIFAFLLAAGAVRLNAQVTTATITGTVVDPSGAAVADAAIQVKNRGTDATQSVTSDGQGRFNVPSLSVGDYDVTASKAGFATSVRTGITLTVGNSTVVDFVLQVGQSNQTVTVAAETAQVDTTSSTLANLVDSRQIVDLPLNGRNFQQLIALSPGVVVAQTSVTSFYGKGDTYSIAGSRPEGAAYLLDGTDITNFFNHGSGAGSLGTSLGIDAIAEFQTLTNTYSAQFGGNGAVINAVSKSGTNGFHGSAFEFIRNSALDARDFFAPTSSPPPFRRNQFGGSFGGPIKKDKMFFFVNYEGLQQSLGITNKITVPDAAAHQGYLPCGVVTGGIPCGANNLAFVGFASPALAAAMATFPTATIPILNAQGLPTGAGNAFANGSEPASENYVLSRFDYSISTSDSVLARYVLDKSSFTNPFPGTNAAGWPDSEPTRNQYMTVEERHIFSSNLINVARASFVRTENSAASQVKTPALQFYPHLGGQDGNITIVGETLVGPSALTPYSLIQNKFAESDDVYLTHGAHSIKFGLGVQRIQTFENQPFSGAGAFTFNSLQLFMQGNASRFGGAYPVGTPSLFGNYNVDAYRSFRETMLVPYINDDWKVSAKLTVNIGVRYDFDTNPKTAIDNLLLITNPPYNSIGGPYSTGFTPSEHVWRKNPSLNNWGPRLGLAWDPFSDHKTSVRAGFGDTHNVIAPRVYTSGFVTGPPFASVIVTPNAQIPVIPFPNPFVASVAPPLPSNGQAVDYNTDKTPVLYQWNANVQRELPGDVVLTVGYVGSHGSHLMTGTDLNPPVPQVINGVTYFGNPATGLSFPRWSPNFGNYNALQANGRSSYNSLQINAVHRFSRNFQAQVAYTLGHSIDDGSGSSGLETGGGPRSNPYNFAADRGNSTFDIRHALRINGTYMLPFHRNLFVSGWQISGILSKTTGPPLLLTTGFDQALVGPSSTVNERPNLNPGFTADSIKLGTVSEWYNPAAFTLQPKGTEGNLGRDVIRGPGIFNADISLLKDTKITRISEQFVVQFRAEFFNFLNHPNFGTPNLSIFTASGPNPAAGQITTSNPGTIPRQIQFALKITF